jgi:hypothetical protein
VSLTPIKTYLTGEKDQRFVSRYESLAAILSDHEMAALGDAYVNLIHSLALSRKLGKPVGRKVDSSTLASALKKAGLRKLLPSRTDRHKQADAAESLIVYAWLVGVTSLDETVCIIEKEETAEDGFSLLLQTILERLDLARGKV